jgi:hypothetical protein
MMEEESRMAAMSTTSFRSSVRGGVIPVAEGQTLVEGTEVLVLPLHGEHGTSAAMMAALEAMHPVPPEWIEELNAAIENSRTQPAPAPTLSDPHTQEL